MSIVDLRRLWSLHELDAAILDVRARAANLDSGQTDLKNLKQLISEDEVNGGKARKLSQENVDLELKQKELSDKANKFEKQLYGGSIVNPREVEAMEKEIKMLKKQAGDLDGRLLELMEEIPPAEIDEKAFKIKTDTLKRTVLKKRAQAEKDQQSLNQQYQELTLRRPEVAREVPAPLLGRYEANRKSHGGIGMARITRSQTCEACGMNQADKVVTLVKEGNLSLCEACKRILYWSDGAL